MPRSIGAARLHAARRRSGAVALAGLCLAGLAACGASTPAPPEPASAPAGMPREAASARDVRDAYAALRRPQAATDRAARPLVEAQLSPRFGADPDSVRLVAVTTVGTVENRIYLVAAAGAACLVSSARLEIGCGDVGGTGSQVTVHTIICSPYLPNAVAEVYGSVPDAARDVRIRLRSGRRMHVAARAGFYRYYWPKHRRSLPHSVEWRVAGALRTSEVPLPRGRGWLDCAA